MTRHREPDSDPAPERARREPPGFVRPSSIRYTAGVADERDEVLIRARDLVLAYGERPVLSGVSLEIRRGEFWVLLGSNGSGKTTFLRALLGILPPAAGSLWLHPELASRDRIGFVPQRCEINPTLPTTVREFVSLGMVGIRATGSDRSRRLAEALERVGLGRLDAADYWSLSGGQRQRALVARGLVRRPSILVLDEPMNHLDYLAEESLLRDLLEMNRAAGITLLVVTHDVALAEAHATHVALFRDGTAEAGDRELLRQAGVCALHEHGSTARETDGRESR
jgi:ABC-type Mn2+/Zn2+ transport system ATPase subunit